MEESKTIISDFLNIKSEIEQTKRSYPSIIGKIYDFTVANYYKNKLIKIAKRITDPEKIIIDGNTLDEFLTYIFSSFPPKGEYLQISTVNIIYPDASANYHSVHSRIELSNGNMANVRYNQSEKIIDIEFKIRSLSVTSNVEFSYLTFKGKELYQDPKNNIIYTYIKELNDIILKMMRMYLIEYVLEEKETDNG